MRSPLVALLLLGCSGDRPVPAPAEPPQRFGLGRAVSAGEIAPLDDEVRPDGVGLPPGRGTVPAGAALYAARCASCHGSTGREGPYDPLVGGGEPRGWRVGRRPEGATPATIGNFYPFATTLFDYLNRTMPWNEPGSLSADELYSLVAFLLHENRILPADAVLDAASLPKVKMPARDRFVEAQR